MNEHLNSNQIKEKLAELAEKIYSVNTLIKPYGAPKVVRRNYREKEVIPIGLDLEILKNSCALSQEYLRLQRMLLEINRGVNEAGGMVAAHNFKRIKNAIEILKTVGAANKLEHKKLKEAIELLESSV